MSSAPLTRLDISTYSALRRWNGCVPLLPRCASGTLEAERGVLRLLSVTSSGLGCVLRGQQCRVPPPSLFLQSAQVVPGILPKSLVVPLVKTGNCRVEVPAQVFALCLRLCLCSA